MLADLRGSPVGSRCRWRHEHAGNAAWLALCGLAINLARWTGRLGVGEPRLRAKTLRVRYLALTGRLAVSARRLRLHLPRPIDPVIPA